MTRPKLLDLFCCAGGAARGYQQAGFHVTGVDINPQPRYAGDEFIRADAMALDTDFLRQFDAIHASPPCQGYSDMRHAPGAKGAPKLIGEVREMLARADAPWVIENVPGAKAEMRSPLLLCGSMFLLGISNLGEDCAYLRRHRLFEASITLRPPAYRCRHWNDAPVIGVYGGHARIRSASFGGRRTRDNWDTFGGHKGAASTAMDIDWMTLGELSEAIPPAYTRFIGGQLFDHIKAQRLAA